VGAIDPLVAEVVTVALTTCALVRPTVTAWWSIGRSRTEAANPAVTGCSDSANTCRLEVPAAGVAVVGSVIVVASRLGSIHSWAA